ncbi:hypothetical protein P9112_005705 [Eukaryota sp. TZLM1-RC]
MNQLNELESTGVSRFSFLCQLNQNPTNPYRMTIHPLSYIEDNRKRFVTLSKRRTTLVKQCHELSSGENLGKNHVLLVSVTEAGNVSIYASQSLLNVARSDSFKQLVLASLQLEGSSPNLTFQVTQVD